MGGDQTSVATKGGCGSGVEAGGGGGGPVVVLGAWCQCN